MTTAACEGQEVRNLTTPGVALAAQFNVSEDYTTDGDDRFVYIADDATPTITLNATGEAGDEVTVVGNSTGATSVVAGGDATLYSGGAEVASVSVAANTAARFVFRPGATCSDDGAWIKL